MTTRLTQCTLVSAGSAALLTSLLGSVAHAGNVNYWKQQISTSWHQPLNWSTFSIPDAETEAWFNTYQAPDAAFVLIDQSQAQFFGTAQARRLMVTDWNCTPIGCGYSALIQGLPDGGTRAQLHLADDLFVNADESYIFGSNEAHLSMLSIDLLASEVLVTESNDANASASLVDVSAAIRPGGDGVVFGFGTEVSIGQCVFYAEAPNDPYTFMVQPTAVVVVAPGTDNAIYNADVFMDGTLFCNGNLRVSSLFGLGSIALNGTFTIDGWMDSTFLGSTFGAGTLVKEGPSTVILLGLPKTHVGGTTLRGGTLQTTSSDQLGFGSLRFDGGTFEPVENGFTIADQSLVLESGGGTIRTATQPLTVTSTISGTGDLTKTGDSALAVHGASSYTGGTTVDDGTLQVNNTSGSGTGSGAVTVETGGTLRGTGSIAGAITVKDGGTLTAGIVTPFTLGSLGAGAVAFEAGSTFSVRLTGVDSTAIDRLAVSGAVEIDPDATLVVTLAGGFVPEFGAAFPIIVGEQVLDEFQTVDGPGPGVWSTEATVDGLLLRYDVDSSKGPGTCPGDLDLDDVVDGSDLGLLLAAWGTADGDLNDDGVTDGADLGILLSSWGACE